MMHMTSFAGYGSIAFAVATFVVGVKAARLWYLASIIRPDPEWPREPVRGLPLEPVEPVQSQQGWTVAILEALSKSAAFNARAAKWTAWTVGLGSVSAILGALGSIAS
jgi:hypothetical protein